MKKKLLLLMFCSLQIQAYSFLHNNFIIPEAISIFSTSKDVILDFDASRKASVIGVGDGLLDNVAKNALSAQKITDNPLKSKKQLFNYALINVYENLRKKNEKVSVESSGIPVVKVKNITVELDANGYANIVPSDIDDGSNDAGGEIVLTFAKSGVINATAKEGGYALLQGPTGTVLTGITFASYGTPTGIPDNFSIGSFNALSSVAVVKDYAFGKISVSIPAHNRIFGDPCNGIRKQLYVTAAYASTIAEFNCSQLGINNVTLYVTDKDGNISTKTATVTVEDNRAPIALTQDITIQLGASGNGSVIEAQINNGSTDNCAIANYSLDKKSFDSSNYGVNTVVLTVTDSQGNVSSNTAVVTVEKYVAPIQADNVAPIVIAKDITVQLDANGYAIIAPSAVDNGSNDGGGKVVLTFAKLGVINATAKEGGNVVLQAPEGTIISGITFASYGTPKGVAGNYTIGDFNAVKSDSIVREYALGKNFVTIPAHNRIFGDPCNGISKQLYVTAAYSSIVTEFNCSQIGVNMVALSITDIDENVSTKTVKVTVEDNVAPIVLTHNITIQLDQSGSASITAAQIDNGSTDNCSIATYSLDKTLFDDWDFGENTVTLTVTDSQGNRSTNTAIVTVEDGIVPMVKVKDLTVHLDANGHAIIVSSELKEASDGLKADSGTNSFTFKIGGVLNATAGEGGNVVLQAPVGAIITSINFASYGTPKGVANNFTVGDFNAVNSVSIVEHYALGKNFATIPAHNRIFGDPGPGTRKQLYVTATYTDLEGGPSVEFDCTQVGIIQLPLLMEDENGNKSSATATVTVEDNLEPIVLTQNITIQLNGLGAASITATQINNGSTDNCAIAAYSLDKTNFFSENLGVNTVTLTVTDNHGNTSTKTATVTVENNIVPILTISAPKAISVNYGASLLPINTGLATLSDNSTESNKNSVTYTDSELPSVCGGNITRTWSVKDAANKVITSEQIITVDPSVLPTMVAPSSATISTACGAEPEPSTLFFTNGLSGDSLISGTSFNSTFTKIDNTCGGSYIETWTANDTCGREINSVSRTVSVMQDMGTIESFVFYSSEGAVGNTGVSTITGDIGTSVGAISGFASTSTVSGSTSIANAATTQAKKDLLNLYIHLSNIPVSVTTHAPVFGNGETLNAGVYAIGAAGSLLGTLTLDGQNNPNALFIFKYDGAFSAAASSKIILANGLKASNVIWLAEGAISIGASSIIKGTLFAHTGAVSMGASGDLEGRMISTTGAVTIDSGKAYLPSGIATLPIICVNSSNSSDDLLGSVAKFALFTGAGAVSNIGASGIIGDVGSNAGAITGFETSATSLINNIYNVDSITMQAKADLENAYQQLSMRVGVSIAPTLIGRTLSPGVYSISAAGTLTGTLILDGQGDPNAEFIIKFGGAFSTGAQSKVSLINGARSCNVFWVSEAAISLGASSFMKGTLIAHNGAISMGERGNLEGRMLSTSGAISFNTAVTYIRYVSCSGSDLNSDAISAKSAAKTSSTSKFAVTPAELNVTELMAYPNPFTISTTVSFTIPYEESNVSLVLYDLRGTVIQVLYSGQANANQKYEVQYNRQNLSEGIYLFRLITSKEGKSFKVIVK